MSDYSYREIPKEKIRIITELYGKGEGIGTIAKKVGCSKSTVHKYGTRNSED